MVENIFPRRRFLSIAPRVLIPTTIAAYLLSKAKDEYPPLDAPLISTYPANRFETMPNYPRAALDFDPQNTFHDGPPDMPSWLARDVWQYNNVQGYLFNKQGTLGRGAFVSFGHVHYLVSSRVLLDAMVGEEIYTVLPGNSPVIGIDARSYQIPSGANPDTYYGPSYMRLDPSRDESGIVSKLAKFHKENPIGIPDLGETPVSPYVALVSPHNDSLQVFKLFRNNGFTSLYQRSKSWQPKDTDLDLRLCNSDLGGMVYTYDYDNERLSKVSGTITATAVSDDNGTVNIANKAVCGADTIVVAHLTVQRLTASRRIYA